MQGGSSDKEIQQSGEDQYGKDQRIIWRKIMWVTTSENEDKDRRLEEDLF